MLLLIVVLVSIFILCLLVDHLFEFGLLIHQRSILRDVLQLIMSSWLDLLRRKLIVLGNGYWLHVCWISPNLIRCPCSLIELYIVQFYLPDLIVRHLILTSESSVTVRIVMSSRICGANKMLLEVLIREHVGVASQVFGITLL